MAVFVTIFIISAYDKALLSILFDGSSALTTTDKNDVRDFMKGLLNEYQINANHSSNVIQYYNDAYVEATCQNVLEKASSNLLDAFFNGILITGGGTSLTKALTKAKTELLNSDCSSTESDRKKVALIIASSPNDPTISASTLLLDEAQALKDEGVIIHALGLKTANRTELELVTGDPTKVIMLSAYPMLASIDLAVLVNNLLETEGSVICLFCPFVSSFVWILNIFLFVLLCNVILQIIIQVILFSSQIELLSARVLRTANMFKFLHSDTVVVYRTSGTAR